MDDNPGTGWAVWSGKPIDRDHAAAFRLKEAIEPPKGAELEITLKFNSKHKNHNLGHFRFWATGQPEPSLKVRTPAWPSTTQASRQTQSRRRKDNLRGLFQEGRRPRLFAQEEGRFGKETQRLPSHQGTQTMVMNDAQKRQTHLLLRGEYLKKGEPVSFSTPSFLPPMKDDWPRNRLGLSKWLLSREQP